MRTADKRTGNPLDDLWFVEGRLVALRWLRRHYPFVPPELLEDAVNDAIVVLLQRQDIINYPSSFVTRVAHSRVRDILRKRSFSSEVGVDDLSKYAGSTADDADVLAEIGLGEVIARIGDVAAHLRDGNRVAQALELVVRDGTTTTDAASQMGVHRETVSRALGELRRLVRGTDAA